MFYASVVLSQPPGNKKVRRLRILAIFTFARKSNKPEGNICKDDRGTVSELGVGI